jgi:alkanesulfonate monooxygenase
VPVDFIGTITTQDSPEVDPASGSVLDLTYLRDLTQAHEHAAFDGVLVPFVATLPDTFLVAHYAANHTQRLRFALAHRAGFTAPTVAARALATLDQMTAGRVALHLVTGGSDATQRRDGDYVPKAARYRRTAEYAGILKALWSASGPIDHHGEFYQFEGAWSRIRPVGDGMPIYFGGASPDAHRVAGRYADVAVVWGEPLAGAAEQIAAIRKTAATHGRDDHIRFALAVRPILGRTDAEAWTRARQILAQLTSAPPGRQGYSQHSAGFLRLLTAAEAAEVHDRALWTAPALLPGAHGNATALVGSPDTVVAALLDYVSIGITCFVINGYEPLRDVHEYGKYLIPAVRSQAP